MVPGLRSIIPGMTIAQVFLAEFDHEMRNTRRMLECVPDEALDYKPHERSMSMGRLAGHVAEMAGWGVPTAERVELDIQPPEGRPFEPFEASSREATLEFFDSQVAQAKEAIAKLDDDAMRVDWTLKMRGNPIFTMPRITVLKSMVLNHIIHHRAQLSVYLRINDVAIPGMYGPSADEQ